MITSVVLNSIFYFLLYIWNCLTANTYFPFSALNFNLMHALISAELAILVSRINVLPPKQLGGNDPVVIYFKHSIIVVLPAPLCPQITVNGLVKLIYSIA